MVRPEVATLIDGRSLEQVRPDRALATRRLAVAEEHLESGRANRREKRITAARSAFYEAIWYSLTALLAEFGLRLAARDEDGQHVVLMRFGRAELRDSVDEVEAARDLDAYRLERNQQMYRQPGASDLGSLPKHAAAVVAATRDRLG